MKKFNRIRIPVWSEACEQETLKTYVGDFALDYRGCFCLATKDINRNGKDRIYYFATAAKKVDINRERFERKVRLRAYEIHKGGNFLKTVYKVHNSYYRLCDRLGKMLAKS